MDMLNPLKTKKSKKINRASNKPKKPEIKKINSEVLNEFVKNNVSKEVYSKLLKIDQRNVFYNFFRINVWTIQTSEDRVIPSFNIPSSFMVELTDSGDIIDVTIRDQKIST